MTEKGRKLSLLSVVLVVVLALATVFNASFAVGSATASTVQLNNNANANNTFKNVTGSVNLDSLREQYLNTQKVEKNPVANYDGERWVIVELEGENLYSQFEKSARYSEFEEYCDSIEGKNAKARLERAQSEFVSKLEKHNIDYILKHSYTTFNNGIAVKVNANGYNAIKKMSGVVGVYFSESYAVPTVAVSNNANVYTTGIYDSSDLDFKGEGMVVAILDTGLDYTHEAFQTMPNADTMRWNKDDVATLLQTPDLHAKGSVDQIYYNDKVPFAYDYADDDTDVYPSYSSHGTHVAGIVAGSSDYQVNKENPAETFVGVAPNAQLAICKVFTDNLDSDELGGADTMDILAAVSDCAKLGVDVINMSLGSSCGFSNEESEEWLTEVYNSVRKAGISLVVAASNDYSSGFGGGNGTNLASNPDSATVGSPSTYPASLSVASINGRLSSYIKANNDENQVAFITESSDENGNEYDFIEQLYKIANKDKSQELTFKYVTVGGVGRSTNYTASVRRELANKEGYDGTIALVKRGDNTFAEKVQLAMDNGADACIIYNNLSGTIRMSLGEVSNPIPTCSIGMDAGKQFSSRTKGTITVSDGYKAGPFMSDFSSWGPNPDLQLKPEITAHGGEIVSAVPGGYDVYSGTSMASPNMAGAVALLRQYLQKETNLTGTALNARVNQVLMSTATIALNEEGNPYSPRKQGAGLAGIKQAISTESYLTVLDALGNAKDKTKLELGDDKAKTGVYTLDFVINNISGKAETYNPVTYVMTETLASNNKTVAEKAYMLNDSDIVYYLNGSNDAHQGEITVGANEQVSVKVIIKLSDKAKKYIDDSFKNGMYVEGFVSLEAEGNTKVTIGLPYLAFYGDWTAAPLFDYDTYEIAESEADTGVDPEDKLKASAAATRPLGLYYNDQYILELGSYIYSMDESEVKIYPDKEKAAVSIFDTSNNRTIYEVYMVYAGLLRNAKKMDIVITDAITGEVIYSKQEENIGKSYAAGGSNRGAPIMLEINPSEWNLNNNRTYYVSLKGQLDYEGGENPDRNTFDFQFTVDYEAPQMLGYRIRYEAYTENKQTKYRIYMDIDVTDNQYVMDVMPCYGKETPKYPNGVLTLLTEYPIPVYGQKGETSTVSFEITDIYEDYVKKGELVIAIEDYAMNQSTYVITLNADEALDYPESVEFNEDGKLFLEGTGTNEDGSTYGIYDLSLAPNELYKLSYTSLPNQEYFQNLVWTGAGAVVKAKGDELFASRVGKTSIKLTDGREGTDEYGTEMTPRVYAEINVEIAGTDFEEPEPTKISILPALNKDDYVVSFEGTLPLFELNPNQTVRLRAEVSPWYISDVEFEWSSTNPDIVTVDANSGSITARKKGNAQIKVTAKGYDRLSKSIQVKVGSDYSVTNYTLYDYYGGPNVEIPENLNIMYLDEDCFQLNTTIERVVLPSSLTEIPERAFKNCTNLKEIVIPSQCAVIRESAFEGCVSLERIELKMFEDRDHNVSETLHGALTIGRNAFKGCEKLNEITNQERLTTIYDNAFEGCTSLLEIDLSQLRVTGSYAFKGCTNLASVKTSSATNIGEYMFYGCTALESFTFKGDKLKVGAFMGCTNLKQFTFAPESEFLGISSYALANTALQSVILPNGNYPLEDSAFADCAQLTRVGLSANTQLKLTSATPFTGCTAFTSYSAASNVYSIFDGILYDREATTVISVPTGLTSVTLPASVTAVGSGAFAGVANMQSVDLSNITNFGNYAFANSGITEITLPAGMTSLPEGAFFGCEKLHTVNGAEQLLEVGKQAFYNCKALSNINLAEAHTIGDGAFQQSGLRIVTAPKAEKISAHAFEGSMLVNVELPLSKELGYRAFASISSLKSVILGGITTMASNVFAESANIETAVFGAGTTEIGDYAFYSNSGTLLKEITLPNGITRIGEYAFGASKIETINLSMSGGATIGDYAFFLCQKLASVDLSNVIKIGEGAFAGTGLKEANLAKATDIGYGAFLSSELENVTFGALEQVGGYAFSNTKLKNVVLPASFNEYQYEYKWTIYDHKGRVEETKERKEHSYGAGAFASISTLESITVEGEGDFFSQDGVLYSRVGDGYILEQYPANKEDLKYTVIDNTIAIGDYAFESANNLVNITFPYTVKRIGDGAFYNSNVSNYTFTSVQAPTLDSSYVDGASYGEGSLEYVMFYQGSRYALGSTIYYSNFNNYVVLMIEKDVFDQILENPISDFGLTLNIPKNGTGYDSNIWTGFFSTINRSRNNEADDTTHVALEAIANLPSVEDISAVATLDELTKKGGFADMVKDAREKYNRITLSEQVILAQESYEALLKAESAIRNRKAQLGAPVAIDKLVVASMPNKIRYNVGEQFDKTGLVIKILFEDGSEIDVTDECSFNIDVISADDSKVVATYVTNGQTYTVDININVNQVINPDPVDPVDPDPTKPTEEKDNKAVIIAVSVVVPVVVLICGAVVAIVLIKKKKATK